jgi:hypothetical protein
MGMKPGLAFLLGAGLTLAGLVTFFSYLKEERQKRLRQAPLRAFLAGLLRKTAQKIERGILG